MSLAEVRAEIDRLDDRIVALLGERQAQVTQAARYKKSEAEVHAPDRRSQLMVRLRERAVQEGVAPDVVAAVYTAMIDAFIEHELREHQTGKG